MVEKRPNPDELLSRISTQEGKKSRGHFRLFFGMAAGVGKTCAMLKAAQERLKEGIDVRIGVVETHGRTETQNLLSGIPSIPLKKISYRDTFQDEMDLEAILTLRPKLVLVDELAHTNVPGSQHTKRYQDVYEILEAGIDVYSTMNVQHLESRADVVALITAVKIRETVPDSILDIADQIELIDITPNELISRLKEGKIYPGRKSEQALQYFFQEGNLNALREISLRVTADKVERDMMEAGARQSRSDNQLLVAISSSPLSEKLIRTARRIVDDLEVPWVAAHVDTGKVLNATEQNQLIKNLNLAEEMGAQTVTLRGSDPALTLSEYAQNHSVAQMIVGRPLRSSLWPFANRFLEKLIEKNPGIDITILQQPDAAPLSKKKSSVRIRHASWRNHLEAALWILVTSILTHFLDPYLGYKASGFVFLITILLLSLWLPFSSILLAATLSALIWNYHFIPPIGTFAISAIEDFMMFIAYFFIAIASGTMTFQLKRNQKILKQREETTRALYEVLRSMTLVQGAEPLIKLALSKIQSLLQAKCGVLLPEKENLGQTVAFGNLELNAKELAVAHWSFTHGRMAGWSTETLPLSSVMCLALKSGEQKLGVLVFKPEIDKKLNPDQENLLVSITNQIGVVLAKKQHDAETGQANLLAESEKLHRTLLNCISHELRTPLTAIMGAATALQSSKIDQPHSTQLLSQEIVEASERLNHVFENLLDLTRIEAGTLTVMQEWFDLLELIHFTLDHHKKFFVNHQVKFQTPETPTYFFGDFHLLEHALANILLNAIHYTPAGSSIEIEISQDPKETILKISDQGPGIPDSELGRIFDKFYRLPGTPTGGLGLGLSITKNLVELHGGKIEAQNRAGSGATFILRFPFREMPSSAIQS